jgi:hypothetical protein
VNIPSNRDRSVNLEWMILKWGCEMLDITKTRKWPWNDCIVVTGIKLWRWSWAEDARCRLPFRDEGD